MEHGPRQQKRSLRSSLHGFKKNGICPFSFEAQPKESFLISKELLGQSDNELRNQSQEVTATEAPYVPADIFAQDQMDSKLRNPTAVQTSLMTFVMLKMKLGYRRPVFHVQ